MNKNRRIVYVCFTLIALASLTAFGQGGGSERVVKPRGYVSASAIRPGDKFKVAVVLEVTDGYHINAHVPTLDSLVATNVEFKPPAGITIKEVKYPEPDVKSFDFSPDAKLSVHEGAVVITVEAEASGSIKPGAITIPARVTVQSCNNSLCLSPADMDIDIPVQAVAKGVTIQPANADIFSGAVSHTAAPAELTQFQGKAPKKDEFGELIASIGLPLALLGVLVTGLGLNLTPCVFPIIPITIGFFVNQAASQGKPRLSRTFLMALMYMIGMAITYSALGVIASLTGGLFGAALQSPVVLIGLALVMTALALSMFGVYEFRMPEVLNRFANNSTQSTSGVIGALVMGLTMGIVAAPCIGPVVLGLLVHVSAKGDPAYGFLIFFVLSIGLGLPYLILGTFSGAIKALPRSGEWMITVRKVFGLVLVGMALYFLMPLMGTYKNYVMIAFFVLSAVYLIFWESGKAKPRQFAWVLRVLGAGAATVAIIIAVPKKVEAEIPWQPYSEHLLASAQKEGKAVIIDAFADWCIPCKELDHSTFTDPQVKKESTRFVALKLDLTSKDPASEAGRAKKRFDIYGVPTVLFLDAKGREDESLRLTGFEDARLFLGRMKRMAASSTLSEGDRVMAANAGDAKGPVADAGPGTYATMPAISLNLLEGGKLDLQSLKGKVVMVDFWATWCVPCLSEIPMFNDLYKSHKARGFEMIGISMDDEGASKVKPFVKAHPMSYTLAVGSAQTAEDFNKLDWSVLPVTLVIDKQGRIRFTHIGVTKKEEFETEISQLMAE